VMYDSVSQECLYMQITWINCPFEIYLQNGSKYFFKTAAVVFVYVCHRRYIWCDLVQSFCSVLFVVATAAAAVYLLSDTTFFHKSCYCAVY
jgi:hypothetical protein